jgi:hypothetical protein
MESNNYRNLISFLTNKLNYIKDSPLYKDLQKQAKHFIIKNNLLYKIDKRNKGNLIRVLQKYELDPVLYNFHNDPLAAHFATDNMFEKMRDRYYWPQMYKDIRNYVRSYDSCQWRGKK